MSLHVCVHSVCAGLGQRGHLAFLAFHLPQLSPVLPCHVLRVIDSMVVVTTRTFASSESWLKLSHASLPCFELTLKALGL